MRCVSIGDYSIPSSTRIDTDLVEPTAAVIAFVDPSISREDFVDSVSGLVPGILSVSGGCRRAVIVCIGPDVDIPTAAATMARGTVRASGGAPIPIAAIVATGWESGERAAAAAMYGLAADRFSDAGSPARVGCSDLRRPPLYTDAATAERLSTWSVAISVEGHWTESRGSRIVSADASAAFVDVRDAGALKKAIGVAVDVVMIPGDCPGEAAPKSSATPFGVVAKAIGLMAARIVDDGLSRGTEAAARWLTCARDARIGVPSSSDSDVPNIVAPPPKRSAVQELQPPEPPGCARRIASMIAWRVLTILGIVIRFAWGEISSASASTLVMSAVSIASTAIAAALLTRGRPPERVVLVRAPLSDVSDGGASELW